MPGDLCPPPPGLGGPLARSAHVPLLCPTLCCLSAGRVGVSCWPCSPGWTCCLSPARTSQPSTSSSSSSVCCLMSGWGKLRCLWMHLLYFNMVLECSQNFPQLTELMCWCRQVYKVWGIWSLHMRYLHYVLYNISCCGPTCCWWTRCRQCW